MKKSHRLHRCTQIILAIALLGITKIATAQTTVLANFDFNEGTSLPQNANTTASNITASINGTESDASYSGTATGSNAFVQNTTAGNAMSMSGNTNTNTWTLTMGGSNLYLYASYKLYFQAQRSSTGATTITLSYSTDGTNFTNVSTTASPGNGSFAEATIDMSSITAINNASALYIKFTGSGSTNSGGTLRMDNLEIQGTESSSGTNGNNTFFNGNVGIGTNTPAYPLDVVGAARISGALTSGATTVSSLSNSGATTLTGAVTTGALTSGATNVSSLSNSGNLSVTGTTNLTGALTSGATTVNSLNVSLLTGTGNRQALITPAGNIIGGAIGQTLSTSCVSGAPTWSMGGDNLTSVTTGGDLAIGTCDNNPFILKSNGVQSLFLVPNTTSGQTSLLGIGTPYPSALLHINTGSTGGSFPALIIDNNNGQDPPYEFNVTSDGSMILYNIPSGHDMVSINSQYINGGGGTSTSNFFRITSNGLVGIGGVNPAAQLDILALGTNAGLNVGNGTNSFFNVANNGNVGIGTNTPSALLHVQAQTPTSGGGSAILMTDVSNSTFFDVTTDGSLFLRSSSTTPPIGIVNSSLGILFEVGTDGSITSNALASSTATGNRSLSVDPTGKIVANAGATAGSGAAWVTGGNTNGSEQTIGTKDGYDLPFVTGTGAEAMRIDAAGNVLINTATSTAPSYKKTLTVNGDVCFANYSSGSAHQNDGVSGLEILGDNKVPTSRGITTDSDPNGDFNFYLNGYQGYGTGISPSEFNFKTNVGGTLYNLMTLNASGMLVLGNPSSAHNTPNYNSVHNNALLQVNGDVVVGTLSNGANLWVTQSGWADFVFDNNYKLMSLNEVEKFYKANHHLPDVPTAKDIQEQGNNLGQTDAVLLQKIEELTLYLVKQQKEIEELKALIKK